MKNLVLGNYLVLYITNPLVNNLRAIELFFSNPLVSTNLTNVFFVQITATSSNLIKQKDVPVSVPLLIYIGILYKGYFFISIEDWLKTFSSYFDNVRANQLTLIKTFFLKSNISLLKNTLMHWNANIMLSQILRNLFLLKNVND